MTKLIHTDTSIIVLIEQLEQLTVGLYLKEGNRLKLKTIWNRSDVKKLEEMSAQRLLN